jgi:hypothetical protein
MSKYLRVWIKPTKKFSPCFSIWRERRIHSVKAWMEDRRGKIEKKRRGISSIFIMKWASIFQA